MLKVGSVCMIKIVSIRVVTYCFLVFSEDSFLLIYARGVIIFLNTGSLTFQKQSLYCLDKAVAQSINARSSELFELREHALIGVSPFNSYFVESTLVKVIKWVLNNFKKMTIFIPDTLSFFTLLALGYDKEKAAYKTRRQDGYLKNKVVRALKIIGFNQSDTEKIILTFSQVHHNEHYQILYNRLIRYFEADAHFKYICFAMSDWILSKHLSTNIVNQQELDIAVWYFLYELPILVDSPTVLSVPSSIFIYHITPNSLKKLYLLDKVINLNQGFLELKFIDH